MKIYYNSSKLLLTYYINLFVFRSSIFVGANTMPMYRMHRMHLKKILYDNQRVMQIGLLLKRILYRFGVLKKWVSLIGLIVLLHHFIAQTSGWLGGFLFPNPPSIFTKRGRRFHRRLRKFLRSLYFLNRFLIYISRLSAYLYQNNVWLRIFSGDLLIRILICLRPFSSVVRSRQENLLGGERITRTYTNVIRQFLRLSETFRERSAKFACRVMCSLFTKKLKVYNSFCKISGRMAYSRLSKLCKSTLGIPMSICNNLLHFYSNLKNGKNLFKSQYYGYLEYIRVWSLFESGMRGCMNVLGCNLIEILINLGHRSEVVNLGSRWLLWNSCYSLLVSMIYTMALVYNLAKNYRYIRRLPIIVRYNYLLLPNLFTPFRRFRKSRKLRRRKRKFLKFHNRVRPKNSTFLKLLIKSTKSNCFVNLVVNGRSLVFYSCGKIGFRKTHRATYFAAKQMGFFVGSLVKALWSRIFFPKRLKKKFKKLYLSSKKSSKKLPIILYRICTDRSFDLLFTRMLEDSSLNSVRMCQYKNIILKSKPLDSRYIYIPVYDIFCNIINILLSPVFSILANKFIMNKYRHSSVQYQLINLYYRLVNRYGLRDRHLRNKIIMNISLKGVGKGRRAIPNLLNTVCDRLLYQRKFQWFKWRKRNRRLPNLSRLRKRELKFKLLSNTVADIRLSRRSGISNYSGNISNYSSNISNYSSNIKINSSNIKINSKSNGGVYLSSEARINKILSINALPPNRIRNGNAFQSTVTYRHPASGEEFEQPLTRREFIGLTKSDLFSMYRTAYREHYGRSPKTYQLLKDIFWPDVRNVRQRYMKSGKNDFIGGFKSNKQKSKSNEHSKSFVLFLLILNQVKAVITYMGSLDLDVFFYMLLYPTINTYILFWIKSILLFVYAVVSRLIGCNKHNLVGLSISNNYVLCVVERMLYAIFFFSWVLCDTRFSIGFVGHKYGMIFIHEFMFIYVVFLFKVWFMLFNPLVNTMILYKRWFFILYSLFSSFIYNDSLVITFKWRVLLDNILFNFIFMKCSLVRFLEYAQNCLVRAFFLSDISDFLRSDELHVSKRRLFRFFVFNRKIINIPHNGCRMRKLRRK